MDFFQRQEEARRASGRLTLLFIGAALLMIVGLYGGLLALAWAGGIHFTSPFWWHPILLVVATAVTLLLMGGSAWRASHRLQKSGGSHVAHRLGARPLRPEVPAEATLQNVVEEVAIAAGLPAPWVYLLDNQPGINAMAAGCAPSDAVLIVTDGALQQLSRDALQGVVAHEFSHILYGDMRLNTRLLGLLRGLMGPPRLSATVLRTSFPVEKTRVASFASGCSFSCSSMPVFSTRPACGRCSAWTFCGPAKRLCWARWAWVRL